MDVDTAINPNATGVDAAANQQGYSHCLHFSGSDFETTTLNPSDRWTQAMHFSPWSDYDGRDNDPKKLVSSPVCRDAEAYSEYDASSEVLALSKNTAVLKSHINGLKAEGNTSIDIGMKWGVALLDPSTQPIIDHLIDEEMVSDDFADRPTKYEDGDALKVVVLMTDGQTPANITSTAAFAPGNRTSGGTMMKKSIPSMSALTTTTTTTTTSMTTLSTTGPVTTTKTATGKKAGMTTPMAMASLPRPNGSNM